MNQHESPTSVEPLAFRVDVFDVEDVLEQDASHDGGRREEGRGRWVQRESGKRGSAATMHAGTRLTEGHQRRHLHSTAADQRTCVPPSVRLTTSPRIHSFNRSFYLWRHGVSRAVRGEQRDRRLREADERLLPRGRRWQRELLLRL